MKKKFSYECVRSTHTIPVVVVSRKDEASPLIVVAGADVSVCNDEDNLFVLAIINPTLVNISTFYLFDSSISNNISIRIIELFFLLKLIVVLVSLINFL